ncbi:tripartite tricarboxylate transporter TctB family protein [Paracoccus sp. TK19116]|uniref:Tripartite tricarboxylate transporter TctB family protein n=1 Tax=Paracoccus albicereus TaxID=2922394 RepID=A0ABT1MN79_9RHOB|nr:tripartite tricarboxylate transporter TctB family protein [Paracoccus albicereus]MCQ0969725.1 tripartite tricarboxylate transporter TctB family protein [Paracoccus albicereus]
MRRDWHDLLGGVAMVATGLFVSIYSQLHYDIGSLRQMGPGFFPVTLGGILAVLGLAIALPAWRRSGTARPLALPEMLAILAAIAVFGFGLQTLGIVVATAIAVVLASLPAPRPGWIWRCVLAVAVTALTWLVFKHGLRMTMPVWPEFPG